MWSPTYSSDELYHHGILGMKWGVRRYQNPDGTLTAAGRKRYFSEAKKVVGKSGPYEYKSYSKHDKDKLTKLTDEAITSEQRKRLKSSHDNITAAGKKSRSKYGPSKEETEAVRSFIREREKVVNEILGKYSTKKINTFSLDDATYGKRISENIDWNSIINKSSNTSNTSNTSNLTSSKVKIKSAAKTALKIGATVAVAYAGYKVTTSPKLRRMAMKGMDRLKGVNTKQSIEQLISNSGPKIVKKNRGAEAANAIKSASERVSGINAGNEALRSASKLANEAKKVTLGTQYSKDAAWQAMHEKIDKSALEGLHQYHPSERASKVKTVAEAAKKQHAYLNELERNAAQYGAQVKSGAKVANTTAARATDLEKLLANNRRMQMMANESYKAATKSTESLDYAKELLKKNKGKLSGYTMKDLKDLDLY